MGSGVAQPGDKLGSSPAPLIRVPLDSIEALTEGPSTIDAIPSVDVVGSIEALEPKPPPADLLDRLDDVQRVRFREMRNSRPPHLRDIRFDLEGSNWRSEDIKLLGSVLLEYEGVRGSVLEIQNRSWPLPYAFP